MTSKKESARFGRFKDLQWFEFISQSQIFIGGAGGIGSWLSLFLARTGAELVVLDADTVDVTNLAGQCYGPNEVGRTKVAALATVIDNLCGCEITQLELKIGEEEEAQWMTILAKSDVTCVTFDNMATRKKVFDVWLKGEDSEPAGTALFVDCRMGAENGEVFMVPRGDKEAIEFYKASFFEDSEVEDAPCTAKATTHCGAMIATLAVAQITNWCSNRGSELKRDVLPHFQFHIPVMMFKKQYIELKEENVTEAISDIPTGQLVSEPVSAEAN